MIQPVFCRLAAERTGTARFVAVTVLVAICGGCGSRTANNLPETDSTPATSPATPQARIDTRHPTVRIETTAGSIVVKLDGENSPGTVRNFLDYVHEDFYSGTLVHFVEPGKMILGGGYTEDGELKATRRPPILNESHNGLKNSRGTLAMARSADIADGSTTQFFINLADSPELDHVEGDPENYGYCVFGDVVEGLDVAERISKVTTHDRGGDLVQTPQTPIVIKSIDVVL